MKQEQGLCTGIEIHKGPEARLRSRLSHHRCVKSASSRLKKLKFDKCLIS